MGLFSARKVDEIPHPHPGERWDHLILQASEALFSYGFGPENVGLIFPMIASHLKTG